MLFKQLYLCSKLTWTYPQGHETRIWKCPKKQDQKKQQAISLGFGILILAARSFCLHWYWDTESEASDARIHVLLLNSNLAAKMKRLPQPTNEHYLNFKTSRGQGEFIIVLHWNEVGKGTGRSPFKIFHWVILYLQPCVEMQPLRQQTYFFSLLITLWTTRHDMVHRESENKYRLRSCNLSNDCRGVFFFFLFLIAWVLHNEAEAPK